MAKKSSPKKKAAKSVVAPKPAKSTKAKSDAKLKAGSNPKLAKSEEVAPEHRQPKKPKSESRSKFELKLSAATSKLGKIKWNKVKSGFKFVFKWIAISAIIFFFVGGTIIAAWMSNRDSNQQKKKQEEFQKQLEEYQKKVQEEQDAKPKEYDESLKYTGEITSLQIVDEKTGDGAEAKAGDSIKVKYKGALAVDGQVFDQSDEPIELSLNSVIEGWKEGIPGMKVGGVRILRIPADKAYGEQGSASIPANSNLVFRVELTEITSSQ